MSSTGTIGTRQSLSGAEAAGDAGPSGRESQGALMRSDKIIEIVAVLLLGLTTLGTAWCAFQATQWSGQSADLGRQASQQSIESSRLFGLASQTIAYDSMSIAQYAQAVAGNNPKLREFYRTTLIRPALRPLLEKWESEVRAGQAPVPLTEDKEYLHTLLAGYEQSVQKGAQLTQQSQEAGATGAAYVSVTILLAVALFFSGVISSFRYRAARALLLAAALATLGIAASRLASLPVLF